MRLCFDMDGTLTEGRFLPPPRTEAMYMGLKPYDEDTIRVWNTIVGEHECYIMTARSDYRADKMIEQWLWLMGMRQPVSIITGIPQPQKWFLASQLYCDVMIDDSPNVAETVYNRKPEFIFMDNPVWQKNQEHTPYRYIHKCESWKQLGELIEAIYVG